jgi:hypothetical protein
LQSEQSRGSDTGLLDCSHGDDVCQQGCFLIFAIQGSSLFRRSGLPARSNSHSVVARSDRTRIPLATGRLERTGPFFVAAFEAKQSIGSSTRIGRG